MRDFEHNAGVIKKEKESDNERKDKARTDVKATGETPNRKQWAPSDWAAWKKTQREQQADTKTDTALERTDGKTAPKEKQPHAKRTDKK